MFKKENLHHAYIIPGLSESEKEEFIDATLLKLEVKKLGNPDVHILYFDTFGIDDARSLSLSSLQKSVSLNKKLYFLSIGTITTQAQNALLKIFEEPTVGTHFFVFIPSTSSLLPTLLSRCEVIEVGKNDIAEQTQGLSSFVSLSYKERFKVISKLIEEKDIAKIKTFLNRLEKEIHDKWLHSKDDKELKSALEEIVMVQKYASDQSASYKFLLEHIVLSIPLM